MITNRFVERELKNFFGDDVVTADYDFESKILYIKVLLQKPLDEKEQSQYIGQVKVSARKIAQDDGFNRIVVETDWLTN